MFFVIKHYSSPKYLGDISFLYPKYLGVGNNYVAQVIFSRRNSIFRPSDTYLTPSVA